ncbi:MAG: chorismate mutase [Patescibacteria group bacterium]
MKTKTNPKLEKLGQKLARLDWQLVNLMARRLRLSRQVADAKKETGEPIFRASAERARLHRIAKWATEQGINPEFARTLLYNIIGESCKQQMIHLQTKKQTKTVS